ncbi:MAG: DUF5658 family protein [Actinomycetota bacterium]
MASGVEHLDSDVIVGAPGRLRTILDDPRWFLYAGLVVLNVFDIITTAMVLDRGGSESNPFVQPFVESIWQVSLLKAAVLVIIAVLVARVEGSRLSEFALAGTAGWYLAVVSWNVAVLAIL